MLSKGSFEDYLYILIGVVWVAFSIYKGSKNKKRVVRRPQKPKAEKGFFETLINEFTEVKQSQEDVPSVAKDPAAEISAAAIMPGTEEKVFSYDDIYEEENYSEVEDAAVAVETRVKAGDEQKTHNQQNRQRRFNFKKAIIYSEILQPKYF